MDWTVNKTVRVGWFRVLYRTAIRTEYIMHQADRVLFANAQGFNELQIWTREPIPKLPCPPPDISLAPHLLAVTARGLVLGYDHVGDCGQEGAGYHHILVPWASVAYMYQYIKT